MIKKNILFLASSLVLFVKGMENNSWNVTSCGTKINLTKGSIRDAEGKVDIIVIGHNQQRMLQGLWMIFSSEVGTCFSRWGMNARFKYIDEGYESGSDEDEYKKFTYDYWSNKEKNSIFCRTTQSNIVSIIEPCISYYASQFLYKLDEPINDAHLAGHNVKCFSFYDDEAFEQAAKGLDRCYTNVLEKSLEYLGDKQLKSIALPTLSTDVGFPRKKAARVAVNAVFEFIKNHPNSYDCIEFFVKKRSEFALYKLLLMKHSGLINRVVLLYSATHKGSESNFTLLPRELIDYIATLI